MFFTQKRYKTLLLIAKIKLSKTFTWSLESSGQYSLQCVEVLNFSSDSCFIKIVIRIEQKHCHVIFYKAFNLKKTELYLS